MSQLIARQVVDRMNLRECFYEPGQFASLTADLHQLAEANATEEQEQEHARNTNMMSAYGMSGSTDKKPFAFASGIAIIPVHGTLINRFGASWGYVTGYNFVRAMLNAAVADPDVEGIILDINSPGGEAAGCFELAEDIYQARGKKPVLGVVDSKCYSAAYAIGSACSKLVVTPSGGAGSIGVVCMHVSVKALLDEIGYEITFVYAGAHKVDGNPFENLSDEVKADLQAGVDKSYEKFVSLVARNRRLDAQVVRDTEARCYRAEEAVDLGLIDAIATPSQAVAAFFDELSSGSTLQENTMSIIKKDAAAAESSPVEGQPQAAAPVEQPTPEASEDAKKLERQRVSAILSCEAAGTNAELAHHLALETDLSVEQAVGILSAAAPASAAATPAAANPFQQAMDGADHPNMSADDGNPATEGAPNMASAASSILNAHAMATGRTYN